MFEKLFDETEILNKNVSIKQYFKENPKSYYIFYNRENHEKVILSMLKTTSNFFVLNIDEQIFKEIVEDQNNHCFFENLNRIDYVRDKAIFFIKPKKNSELYNVCNSVLMIKEVEKKFLLVKLEILYDFFVLEFERKTIYSKLTENKKLQDEYWIRSLFGIGDFFMLYSILYESVSIRSLTKNVRFITNASNITTKEINILTIFKHTFPKVHIVYFNNIAILNYIEKAYLKHAEGIVYKGKNLFYKEMNGHFIDFWKDELEVSMDLDPYKHSEKLELLRYIKNGKSVKYKVGIQFHTKQSHDKLDISFRRNLSYNCIQALAHIMGDYAKIFILSDHPYGEIENTVYAGNTSLIEYIDLISQMDLIIGLDSSAGHISSFLNIPTITIWTEKQTPILMDKVSFRVLRKNYSFLGINTDGSNVKIVSDIAKKILEKNIVLTDKIISFEDSKKGFQIVLGGICV